MDKSEVVALLGRPLTSYEDTNFDKYLNIANENLETLLCTPVEEVSESRVFATREDYKTAFVDIFWQITEVKLNDEVTTDYQVMQWDRQNGSWYNSLVFDDYLKGHKLEITADWGFPPASDASSLPVDLQMILAGLFGLVSKKNKTDGSIQSKQVEDFRVTLREVDLDAEFYDKYRSTIAKYSLCNIPDVRQGKTGC